MHAPLIQQQPIETRLLGADADFALVSALVPKLANSLLVQLFRCPLGESHSMSLYAVYREGGMTFDAIVGFDAGMPSGPLADLLEAFVRGGTFRRAVLTPLRQAVEKHFAR
jgi:hypothetical protein